MFSATNVVVAWESTVLCVFSQQLTVAVGIVTSVRWHRARDLTV
jgi:hypothetical protein